MNLSDELAVMRRNAERLLAELNRSRQENARLREENQALREEADGRAKKLEDLENKNLNLQLSKSFEDLTGPEAEGLREKLDAFILEIEQCIVSLRE